MSAPRPVPWLDDAQFGALVAALSRPADRLIVLALRLHDLHPDNGAGANPGYRRLARLTGLSTGYVRNRLAALHRDRRLHVEHDPSGLAHYYLSLEALSLPEVTTLSPPEGDRVDVTSRGDTATGPVTPSGDNLVTTVSPLEMHRKEKNNEQTPPGGPEELRGDPRPTPKVPGEPGREGGKKNRAPAEGPGRKTTEAQELTNYVIAVGMHGGRCTDYPRQAKHAGDLLQRRPLTDLKRTADWMRTRFPWDRGDTFDVFDVGRYCDKALAKLAHDGARPALRELQVVDA